ncbi:MAG: molybdate ABC transporter permease subunit [Spirochaetaceae bacterium]|nr:MAG: molybdate ABC transporter permease subunit [Spirochaetaceae bacterium]
MDLFPVLLSLRVSALATLYSVAIGLPLAWVFAFRRFPGRSILDAVITLPVVLPPSVLGYYLLLLIGRRGLIGSPLESWFGVRLVFTWHAAVIAAVIAALPLFVRSARAAFEQVDESFLGAARTLGRGELVIFFRILLPLAWRGVLAGVVLCWARALGEFGATLLVAGNIPGRTQTMAIAIYDAVQAQDTARADTLVAILTVTSIAVILTMNYLGRGSVRQRQVRRNRPVPERGHS